MLSLAWLGTIAVVVELYVSVVGCCRTGWHGFFVAYRCFCDRLHKLLHSVGLLVCLGGVMLLLGWLVVWDR